MDFIKKHYEKVLLALVLIGLTAAVGFLLLIIPQKQKRLQEHRDELVNRPAKELTPLDTKLEDAVLARMQAPVRLNLTGKHNLFNPVRWQVLPGGGFRKLDVGTKIGPDALIITETKKLYLIVSFVNTNAGSFTIKIERQSLLRNPVQNTIVRVEGPSSVLNLKHLTGTPENPVELQLEFRDTGETFTLTPDKPFQRIDGYMVDLKYPPDPALGWVNMRPYTGANLALDPRPMTIEGSRYSVVDVKENSVTVSSQANNKRTVITKAP